MQVEEIVNRLKSQSSRENAEGMAKFGIQGNKILGIRIPTLRRMAKKIGKNHSLALNLWDTAIHEVRILATLVDIPSEVTEEQMETWVSDFDSWDLCDQCCNNLFNKTNYAYQKAEEWSNREEEFVKRAGFVLMAILAVHDKKADNHPFLSFLQMVKRESSDTRNFVKKGVNWALRQIGKRNLFLHKAALSIAYEINDYHYKSAKWVASDAIKDLTQTALLKRLSAKE